MIKEYSLILERGKLNKKKIQKKLNVMKKQRRLNLDDLFSREHDKAFQEIDCLKCANCCASLGPLITDKDIGRLAKAARIKPGQVVENYLRIDEEGDYVFKEVPCPFLGSDKYCFYYDVRPDACRRYPYTNKRNIKGYTGQLIKDLAVCPAVVLVLERVTCP